MMVPLQPRRSSSTLPSPLLLGSGKLSDRQEIHALPAGEYNLVFLLDSLSEWRFLIDTRASLSVFVSRVFTNHFVLNDYLVL